MSREGATRSANKFGKYQVVTQADGRPVVLGSGSCGKTYKAVHSLLGRTVALKVIHESLAYDLEVKQRFLNEARAIAALKHPHIAQLVDCDEADGALFYAMEFCDGGDLEKFVSARGALSDETVLQLARQAAKALAYVHDEGYLHRDLKPSNLMLSMVSGNDEANLKVIDFGLVKALGQSSGLTQRGQFRGTLLYTSPEQLREEELDERADVFALGVTLWFLLVGGVPLNDDSKEIARQRLSGEGHAKALPKSSHPAVRALLTEMLQPDRKRRVRNMHIVLCGIDECMVQMRGHKPAAAAPSQARSAQPPVAQSKPAESNTTPPATSTANPRTGRLPREPATSSTRARQPASEAPRNAEKLADQSGQRPTAGGSGTPPPLVRSMAHPLHSKFVLMEEDEDAHPGLGTTHLARRVSTGEFVLLTKVERTLATNRQVTSKLESIVSAASRCEGGFVVQPHSLIRFQDHLVLIEEEVHGLPLLTILKARQKLSLLEASVMLRQLAEACDLAMQAGLTELDLAVHHLSLQFPHLAGAKVNDKEASKMLTRPAGQWPPYIVRLRPDYAAAQRASATDLTGSSHAGSTVMSDDLNDNADLPCRFACLIYHVLSGLPVPAAATMSRAGYVPVSSLGEEGNRLLGRIVSREFQLSDCHSLLRGLWQMESIPAVPLSLPPNLGKRLLQPKPPRA